MLTKPVIHPNGSGKDLLKKQYRDAYDALHTAIGALIEMSPHGRDYYLHPKAWAFDDARYENRTRIKRLTEVQDEVLELMKALDS